jgi:1L-myo-inositol 1-phosphate cytidylyltransferase / CDP-L-myo-inositol myo-inositolphosphotransferase
MSEATYEGPAADLELPDSRPRSARVGVLLAAGRSERLRKVTGGRSKALVTLGGLPLLERAARTLLAGGLERVVVVTGHEAEAVARAVAGLPADRVQVVHAEGWEAGNGASLAAAETAVSGEHVFAVVCADHVFSAGALTGLMGLDEPAVLVDVSPSAEAWDEGTRVRIMDGRAFAFGKHLEDPAIDCGAFVFDQDLFRHLREAASEGDHSLAGAVTRFAQVRPIVAEPLPPGTWWQDVDTPKDLRTARRLLRRSLPKPTDGPVSRYLNRPISTRLSMAISPLRLPPDAISFVVFMVGIMSASFLAAGHAVVGGLMVQATSVLDGVDGETARLQMRANPRGAWLDGMLDRMVDAAIVAGLGLWALTKPFGGRTVLLLLAIAIAWAVIAMGTKDASATYSLPHRTEHLLGFMLGARDGRLLLVAGGALLGRPMLAVVTMSTAWVTSVITRLVVLWRLSRMRRATLSLEP